MAKTWCTDYNAYKRSWDLNPVDMVIGEVKPKKTGLLGSLTTSPGRKRKVLPTVVAATIADNLDELTGLFGLFMEAHKREIPADLSVISNYLKERWEANHMTVYMAYLEGRAIGFTLLYIHFYTLSLMTNWELCDGFVLKAYRGQGIADLLVQEVNKELKLELSEMKEFAKEEQYCRESQK